MADVEEVGTSQTRQGAEQAAALDKVTDMAEERELKTADTSRIKEKMVALGKRQQQQLDEQRQREKELAAVKINAADVDVIVKEFEMDKKKAERHLRVAGGDLKQALKSLVDV